MNLNVRLEHGLAGLKRPLLPYESAFSKLLFISSKNSLSTKEVYKLVCSNKAKLLSCGFLNLSIWIDKNKIYKNFGLNFPTTAEFSFLGKMQDFCPALLSDRLRICPICFDDGYHSYLFQFHDMKICPLHGCRIDNLCQSCGKELAWYGLYPQLFDLAYTCAFCGGMLSGAPFLVDADNSFTSHALEIDRSLEPFQSIVSRLPNSDRDMYRIVDVRPSHSLWCRPRFIQADVSRTLLGLAGYQNHQSSSSIEVLRWGIHMKTINNDVKNTENVSLLRQFNSVWRLLLRRLERWIFGISSENQIYNLMSRVSKIEEFVFFKDFEILQLAYGLFRIQFGNDVYFRPNQSIISPSLRRVPEIGFTDLWEERLPRAALMYGLLGAFSGLYLMLLNRSHHSKYLDLRRLTVVDADFVAMSYSISSSGFCGGVVAFPKIHGLPIRSGGKK